MSKTKNNRATGQVWKDCDRCGFEYPINQLKKQDGFWLCKDMCVDMPGRDYYIKNLVVESETQGAEQIEVQTETFSDGE